MVLFAEFDAKIIHNEDENDVAPFVPPEAQRRVHLEVTVGAKAVGKEVKFVSLLRP